ncbi:type VI secretion system protein ImpD/type VI secretion system protein ImpC [Inquilinus ginsengisoli]|uniref:Type VI secretion system protein ImpD/type VI secretion system protein ImpC n=1 Tax=Inquilinus ginsengisoli TaxID=363840 RepID=A0ABU1JSP7_9PROT|nr:type VI secretion system contractile sheath large subunit [Inquilinus ginsengisoli]MDR6291637.1 type VI secretion system protein ImpD/type VI secretion system protein ImpC [Inquilinus ginsengisoli]
MSEALQLQGEVEVPRPGPRPLRAEVLAGRIGTAGGGSTASRLAVFLRQDPGALASWFGAPLARQLQRDPDRLRALLDRDIVAIDALISAQLDEILHHPRLQRLEGSWRGLAWMVEGFDPTSRLKTRLLSASWQELNRDIAKASEFDQSALFRLIYENEFGTAGGEPFGLMVVDHELRHMPDRRRPGDAAPVDDVFVLSALASIAAAAFMPIVTAAAPALLGVDRFEELALSNDVTAAVRDDDHARWRGLAMREDTRFLCVTLPRVLARPRWRPDAARDGLRYEEHAPEARHRTWSVACYAFAATVGRAQALHNWPADVRGVSADRVGGGLVLDLPTEPFTLGPETVWDRPSPDIAWTDRQERDLVAAGLMPLNTLPYGEAVFAAVHSLQTRPTDPPGRDPTAATANRRLSAQINAMLCVSRFAHYIKIMGREMTGSSLTASEVERRLQTWLSGYTNASLNAGADSRARHPLVSSSIKVHELEGKPGSFGCVIHLQPYYQLDDVSAVFRLVTGLSPQDAKS